MKKWLFQGVISLILLAVTGFSFLWLARTQILANRLESLIKMPVSVADFSISTTDVVVQGLRVSNFPNGRVDPAFSVKKIHLTFGLADLLSEPTLIEDIVIESPQVGIEMYNPQGTDSNWSRILDQISKSSEPPKPGTPAASSSGPSKPKKEERQYLVKHILLTDVRVQAYHKLLSDKVVDLKPIPKIEVKDIGSGKPVPMRVIIKVIAEAILREAGGGPGLMKLAEKAIKELPDKVLDDVQKPIKGVEKEIKKGKELWKKAKDLF